MRQPILFHEKSLGIRPLKPVAPVEVLIDLAGIDQIFELFEAGVAGMLENVLGKADSFKQRPELTNAFFDIPLAAELRHHPLQLRERNPITAIVGADGTEADIATFEHFADNAGNLANPVVLLRVTDV